MTETHTFLISVPYTESSEWVDAEITDRLSDPAYQMFTNNQLMITDWEFDSLHPDINWMYIQVSVSVNPHQYTLLQLSGGVFN